MAQGNSNAQGEGHRSNRDYGLPEGSDWLFLEFRPRAAVVGEVDDTQEGFGLGIVGHGDASTLPRPPGPAIVSA